MDLVSIRKSYRRYARHYDVIFGRVFARGRRLALQTLAPVSGKRVLEVGVGTGISLPFYCPDAEVVGIDVSREMLDIARQRLADGMCPAVTGLAEMNAEHLGFADDSFDAVVAMSSERAIAVWEDDRAGESRVLGAVLGPDGASPPRRLCDTPPEETARAPAAAVVGDRLVVAWQDTRGVTERVRTRAVPVGALTG